MPHPPLTGIVTVPGAVPAAGIPEMTACPRLASRLSGNRPKFRIVWVEAAGFNRPVPTVV